MFLFGTNLATKDVDELVCDESQLCSKSADVYLTLHVPTTVTLHMSQPQGC
jgi:hypothetical protein